MSTNGGGGCEGKFWPRKDELGSYETFDMDSDAEYRRLIDGGYVVLGLTPKAPNVLWWQDRRDNVVQGLPVPVPRRAVLCLGRTVVANGTQPTPFGRDGMSWRLNYTDRPAVIENVERVHRFIIAAHITAVQAGGVGASHSGWKTVKGDVFFASTHSGTTHRTAGMQFLKGTELARTVAPLLRERRLDVTPLVLASGSWVSKKGVLSGILELCGAEVHACPEVAGPATDSGWQRQGAATPVPQASVFQTPASVVANLNSMGADGATVDAARKMATAMCVGDPDLARQLTFDLGFGDNPFRGPTSSSPSESPPPPPVPEYQHHGSQKRSSHISLEPDAEALAYIDGITPEDVAASQARVLASTNPRPAKAHRVTIDLAPTVPGPSQHVSSRSGGGRSSRPKQ